MAAFNLTKWLRLGSMNADAGVMICNPVSGSVKKSNLRTVMSQFGTNDSLTVAFWLSVIINSTSFPDLLVERGIY